MEVVEHLYDDDLHICLQNIRRLLVPGGLLIVTTPNSEDMSLSMIPSPESGQLFHRWQHVRVWTKETLVQSLAGQGYAMVEAGVTDFAFSPTAHRRTYGLLLRVLRALAKRGLAFLRPSARLPHLYVVARSD